MASAKTIEAAYKLAKERYAEFGVNVDAALDRLAGIAISLHCWQADDVGGFEKGDSELGGGLAVTGNYPGKAARPTSCAPTSTRRCPSSPAATTA